MPPENQIPLTEEEKLLFIEWIDLGAQWDLLKGTNQHSQTSQ